MCDWASIYSNQYKRQFSPPIPSPEPAPCTVHIRINKVTPVDKFHSVLSMILVLLLHPSIISLERRHSDRIVVVFGIAVQLHRRRDPSREAREQEELGFDHTTLFTLVSIASGKSSIAMHECLYRRLDPFLDFVDLALARSLREVDDYVLPCAARFGEADRA